MAENQDVNMLKRRGRRRLVGAVALVLAAVIVLPMVFDADPKGSAPPVSVRIPGEDDTGFSPKVTPKGPAIAEQKAVDKASEKTPEKLPEKVSEKAPEKIAEPAPETAQAKAAPPPSVEKPAAEKPAAKIEVTVTKGSVKPAAPTAVEQKRAEAALTGAAGGEQFVVQVGAFADPEKLKEVIGKLVASKIAHYTEQIPVKSGMLTRVRVGPFGSREAAEKALQQMKDLGLKPGNVATKS